MDEMLYADPYAERIAAQRKLLETGASPRFSPEEIAQRRNQNQLEFEIGLASMLSGNKTLTPVGELVYKKAAGERAPRVTDQGEYNPMTGAYTLHPETVRSRQQAELHRMEDAQSAGQRAWQMARQQSKERADAADVQRQFMAGQGDLNRQAGAATRAALQDSRNATVEDRMADDFTRDTKNANTVLGAHKQLQTIAQRTDAPSDIAFIYSYMKMLDPTSVVREGEFATAQNAAGVPDRIRNAYNATMSGQRLNGQQRTEMLSVASRMAEQAQQSFNATADQYGEKAQRRSLNSENVTGVPRVLKNTLGSGPAPSGKQPVRVNY